MRFISILLCLASTAFESLVYADATHGQAPHLRHASTNRTVSPALSSELEEFARIVDITYCIGPYPNLGLTKPFKCLSRCSDFPAFELVKTWNTGPFLSDSCGYIALDHGKGRVIVAFRGTYSVANTVVDLSTVPQKYVPYPGKGESGLGGQTEQMEKGGKCEDCTVHMGFYRAWHLTRAEILQDLQEQLFFYPEYELHLVGHSLGGAVAALAALDLQARGWSPAVTTFGEPRIGNQDLVEYLDARFSLTTKAASDDGNLKYRRVTHVDDPVPLLPLTKWGYAMHAGEIYISKPDLSPDVQELQHCEGDNDQDCIAGQDPATAEGVDDGNAQSPRSRHRDLLMSVQDEVHDVGNEPWGIPSRYKLWQLFFAHRDYFWRLGLCVPQVDGGWNGEGGKFKAEL